MKNLLASVIYFFLGITCIMVMNQSSFWPGFIAKALIIPALIILFLINLNPSDSGLHIYMIAGLFFSWAGDVVLEFTGNNAMFFMIGLGCFLLTHITYFIVFARTKGKNSILRNRVYLLLPVIAYGIVLISYLYSGLSDMSIPVIIYTVAILAMLTGAINRIEKVQRISFYLVTAGAILFVISDSTIAIDRFRVHFESAQTLIMSTYIIAQYLIVVGYIYQFRGLKSRQIR
jgi:uncharacterized membrane protein YhhN